MYVSSPTRSRPGLSAPGRVALAAVASALAALGVAASAASAQPAPAGQPARPDSASRAHEVRRGETLWALAEQYYGNSFRWPTIREANTDRVRDPHWIYPGQKLVIPAFSPAAPDSAAPQPETPAAVDPAPAPAPAPEPPTAFARRPEAPALAAPLPRAATPQPDTAPTRPLEAVAAPYVGAHGVFRGAGVVVDGADIPSPGARGTPRRMQLLDRIVLSLPAGANTEKGTRYVIATPGPVVRDGEVVVPHGIAVLDGGGTETLRTARLVRMFGLVEVGLPVIPVAADAEPTGGSEPQVTHVVWVPGSAELPTLQAYVLLGRGARDGVKVGDRFELVGDGRRTPEGASLPAVRVGIVRVVRVTSDAATAVVEHHDQPAIAPGVEARPLPR